MAAPHLESRSQRQFYWGLSFGVIVLALAGLMWIAWASSVIEDQNAGLTCDFAALIVAGGLVWGGVRVRRKARGFRRTDLRQGAEAQRLANLRVSAGFRLVILGEWSGIGLAAFLAYHFHRPDLFPPAMSLAVAVHFFPLAALFRLPFYHVTAVLGSVISVIALLAPDGVLGPDGRLALIGGFGAVMWGTAGYCLLRADTLAAVLRD